METAISSLVQYVNSDRLHESVPEYLWFVIAIIGIGFVIYTLNRLVNYLVTAVKELKEGQAENAKQIAVLIRIVKDHDDYIKLDQSRKRR